MRVLGGRIVLVEGEAAALERFSLVHEHKNTEQIYVSCSWEEVTKKLRYRPWVVAPIAIAATPSAFAGGGGRRAAAASSTGTTIAEVSAGHRSPRSLWHFPPFSPTPTANRHFGQKWETRTPGGGAIPMCPRRPHVLRAQKHGALTLLAPLVSLLECHLRTLPFLTCSNPVFQVLLCGCSESSCLAQRHPKVPIRYIDVGHGGCDSLTRFSGKKSFPERNTPLISAHGAQRARGAAPGARPSRARARRSPRRARSRRRRA